MNNSATTTRTIRFVVTGIVAIILLYFIFFFINNSFVFVNVSGATGDVSVSDGQTGKKLGGAGLVALPRSTQSLAVSSGSSKTILTVATPPLVGSVSVELKADSNANKLAYASTGAPCAVYSATLTSLLQYDCSSLATLTAYQTPTDAAWSAKTVANLSYTPGQLLPPYESGVVGFEQKSGPSLSRGEGSPVSLAATNASGTVAYDAPSGVNSASFTSVRIITDTSSTTNGKFALIDSFGVVYLASPSSDGKSVSYKRVTASADYSSRFNQTACTLRSDTLYCFRSRSSVALDKGAKYATPTVDTLSFSSGLVSSANVAGAPVVDSINYVAGKLYVTSGKTLYGLDKSPNSYKTTQIFSDTASVIGGDQLYFIHGNGVYALNAANQQAQQIFYSPNIGVTAVYPVDGKVFVFGKPKNGAGVTSAYELLGTADTNNGKRLIDLLPFGSGIIKDVASADIAGNSIGLTATSGIDIATAKANFLGAMNGAGIAVSSANVSVSQ